MREPDERGGRAGGAYCVYDWVWVGTHKRMQKHNRPAKLRRRKRAHTHTPTPTHPHTRNLASAGTGSRCLVRTPKARTRAVTRGRDGAVMAVRGRSPRMPQGERLPQGYGSGLGGRVKWPPLAARAAARQDPPLRRPPPQRRRLQDRLHRRLAPVPPPQPQQPAHARCGLPLALRRGLPPAVPAISACSRGAGGVVGAGAIVGLGPVRVVVPV